MRSTNSAKQVRFLNTRLGFIVSVVVYSACLAAGIYYGLR